MTVAIYIAAGIVVFCLIGALVVSLIVLKEEDERKYGNKTKSNLRDED